MCYYFNIEVYHAFSIEFDDFISSLKYVAEWHPINLSFSIMIYTRFEIHNLKISTNNHNYLTHIKRIVSRIPYDFNFIKIAERVDIGRCVHILPWCNDRALAKRLICLNTSQL